MKWKASDYNNRKLDDWKPPRLVYPASETERAALHALKDIFTPLSPYKQLEAEAIDSEGFVEIPIPSPDGQIAFLENTAEKCTSPTNKHSRDGMEGAKHWVQRYATPDDMFQRLLDGYGISLMFGERFHQFIRNSNNYRGNIGVQLDLDVWYEAPDKLKQKLESDGRNADLIEKRLEENEKRPKPVYSQAELFDRYPLLPRICSYLIPSASSLYDGRPFKARGIVLFDTPITDQRIYRAFGDVLLNEIDCIPANVTKNPVAVGFGNTHNAPQAYYNRETDRKWIQDSIETAITTLKQSATEKRKQRQQKTQRQAYQMCAGNATTGENISAFINGCNALQEMVTRGRLTHVSGTRYRWHESDSDTSCEVKGDGVLHIFSNMMQQASPAGTNEPVNIHRFYLYHLTGLDITKECDKAQCREYLFDSGYGSDPKVFAKKKQKRKNTHIDGIEPITRLPTDHPIIKSAPTVEVREQPSYRHFSKEECAIVRDVLSIDPNAGWHGQTPVFTTRYEYLHPLTNKFALNGQPSEVEKRRVWSTLFGSCEICGAVTAKWVDRYTLEAGYYCDGCHKDYLLGSYLELELNRKLPNSIISEYQGFLGDNPDFVDFRLFEPGMLTHLGAGMGTGKTTEIVKVLVSLAQQGLGKGIIVVPRIALAQQLAYQLRWQHGREAWGLYTEGIPKGNKFLGEHGAIVCLPSLPQVVRDAQDLGIENLYIAIDELDFGYELLSLDVAQATAVKKMLRDALKKTGLVVAGQTESTLALEAFAQEIEAEQVQGFYNTAEPAEGHVVIKQHAADTNINALLGSGIDDIAEHLRNEQNVYAFCASRRDGEILAEVFSVENPLFYNAYTRGEYRAHELLRHQKLTDSRLFIGTSAAAVGISFLDKKALTVIIGGLIFGSRHANLAVQKAIRDRGRRGVFMHYKSYNLSLPMRPTEQRQVSLYHEALKQALNTDILSVPEHAVTKLAAAQALSSLADMQFEAFFRYHLSTVGNMEIVEDTPSIVPEDVAKAIANQRAEIRRIENELKKESATEILKTVLDGDTDTELLTASEIRKRRNRGYLSTDAALAHELANEAARSVGWDDTVTRFYGDLQPFEKPPDPFEGIFDAEDIDVARRLVERNFDFEALNKKRAGYLAVKDPLWTENRFEIEVSRAKTQLVRDGLGIELTAVKDYRLLGELLKTLLDALVGQVFETHSLSEKVKSVLGTNASTGKNFGQELLSGALGASEYRKARFLHCAEDEQILVDWVARFISEWYPARLAKRDDSYALQPDTHAELYLQSFQRWLSHQPDVFDGKEIQLDIFDTIEMPESTAEQKETARGMRAAGATLKAIAAELGVSAKSVSLWCKGIKPKKKTKQTRSERQQSRKSTKQTNTAKKQAQINEAYRLFTQEHLSYREIAKRMGTKHTTISRWFEPFDF